MDDDVYQDRTDNTVTVGLRLETKLRDDSARPELGPHLDDHALDAALELGRRRGTGDRILPRRGCGRP